MDKRFVVLTMLVFIKSILASDSLNVIKLGNIIPYGQSGVVAVYEKNNHKYALIGAAGMTVVDIDNPQDPKIITRIPTSGAVEDIKVQKEFAFLAAGEAGFKVVNMSEPTSPVVINAIPELAYSLKLHLTENIAYLKKSSYVAAINISKPDSCYILNNQYYMFSRTNGFAIKDSVAYITKNDSIVILKIINDSIKYYSYVRTTSFAKQLLVNKDNLYSCDSEGKITIYDINKPLTPDSVACYVMGGSDSPNDMIIYNHLLYIVGSFARLRIIDISNIQNLVLVGGYIGKTGFFNGIDVIGDVLCICEGIDGFSLYKYLNPLEIRVKNKIQCYQNTKTVGIFNLKGQLINKTIDNKYDRCIMSLKNKQILIEY